MWSTVISGPAEDRAQVRPHEVELLRERLARLPALVEPHRAGDEEPAAGRGHFERVDDSQHRSHRSSCAGRCNSRASFATGTQSLSHHGGSRRRSIARCSRGLQEQGDTPNLELARRVGLSPAATSRRVTRLRAEGVIEAVRAVVTPEAVGLPLQAFVLVDARRPQRRGGRALRPRRRGAARRPARGHDLRRPGRAAARRRGHPAGPAPARAGAQARRRVTRAHDAAPAGDQASGAGPVLPSDDALQARRRGDRRVPDLPGEQPVEPARRRPARPPALGRDGPGHRRRRDRPPRLRLAAPTKAARSASRTRSSRGRRSARQSRSSTPASPTAARTRSRPSRRSRAASDRHLLLVQRGSCRLFELFAAERRGSAWHAGSGAIFNLRSNKLRPRAGRAPTPPGCRSCPASPATTRSRAARSSTRCASRSPSTRNAFVFPARHFASDLTDPDLPAMGQRLRLKASVDVDDMPRQARVIATALKRYGMLVADNGSNWFISGAPRPALGQRRAARAQAPAGQRLRSRL